MVQYENEAQAITNLQTYLRHLSYFDPDASKVPIDGVFGSDTEKAVREFQGANGLRLSPRLRTYSTVDNN